MRTEIIHNGLEWRAITFDENDNVIRNVKF